jgi:hypothetical protein
MNQVHIDGKYEYDLRKEWKTITLSYAKNNDWLVEGDCASIYDDGEGLFITWGDEEINIGYHEFQMLMSLFVYYNDQSYNIVETKTIKSI